MIAEFEAFSKMYNELGNKPFDGVRPELLSFAGVFCGVVFSSLPPPFKVFLRIGLKDGALGRDGKVVLLTGGPGETSSMMCEKMLSKLQSATKSLFQKLMPTIFNWQA